MCPDSRSHRGPHPADAELFSPRLLPALRRATAELSWLLTRGYAPKSALALVGNRHGLAARQRLALARAACGDEQREARRQRRLEPSALAGRRLWIDGFNVLVTVEAALAGGVLIGGRDGCLRDLASVHGSYRRVEETAVALDAIGRTVEELAPRSVRWLLDRPVSNSGRLATQIRSLAEERRWPWEVELVASPDGVLARTEDPVATSDSAVLDRAAVGADLARWVVEARVPGARILDLAVEPEPEAPPPARA